MSRTKWDTHAVNIFSVFSVRSHCFTAFIQKNTEEIATEGRSTTITCFYDMEYRFDNKYWCRGSSRTSCDILGETKKFVKWNYENRLTLLDNRKGVFWVTMHQLTEDDSGTYWCGIERPFADIMTSVKLKVNKGKVVTHLTLDHMSKVFSCKSPFYRWVAVLVCQAHTNKKLSWSLRCYWKEFFILFQSPFCGSCLLFSSN
uniref:Ig-like domain-containing protein n=1 Tax=Podarcis muralis TaxID=64176 RepID=A0A670HY04_PODMU